MYEYGSWEAREQNGVVNEDVKPDMPKPDHCYDENGNEIQVTIRRNLKSSTSDVRRVRTRSRTTAQEAAAATEEPEPSPKPKPGTDGKDGGSTGGSTIFGPDARPPAPASSGELTTILGPR